MNYSVSGVPETFIAKHYFHINHFLLAVIHNRLIIAIMSISRTAIADYITAHLFLSRNGGEKTGLTMRPRIERPRLMVPVISDQEKTLVHNQTERRFSDLAKISWRREAQHFFPRFRSYTFSNYHRNQKKVSSIVLRPCVRFLCNFDVFFWLISNFTRRYTLRAQKVISALPLALCEFFPSVRHNNNIRK